MAVMSGYLNYCNPCVSTLLTQSWPFLYCMQFLRLLCVEKSRDQQFLKFSNQANNNATVKVTEIPFDVNSNWNAWPVQYLHGFMHCTAATWCTTVQMFLMKLTVCAIYNCVDMIQLLTHTHIHFYIPFTVQNITSVTTACICLLDRSSGVSQDRCCKILRYTHQTGAIDLNYQVIHLDPGGGETRQLSGTWHTVQSQ